MTQIGKPTFDELSRRMERNLLVVIAAGLAVGLVLTLSGWTDNGQKLMSAGLVVLVLAPVLSLLVTLVGQLIRRSWPFAVAAAVTLAMLIAGVL
jgi:uncharacterized membrane protein